MLRIPATRVAGIGPMAMAPPSPAIRNPSMVPTLSACLADLASAAIISPKADATSPSSTVTTTSASGERPSGMPKAIRPTLKSTTTCAQASSA